MPASFYRLFASAPSRRQDVGQFVEIYDVGIHSLAKRSLNNRYEIANEVIALRLGRLLGLPIPLGAPVENGGQRFYCSLVFAGSGHNLPPADTEKLAINDPSLATAIVLFDAWILNTDRHERNLHYDESDGTTTLIDHGVALFGEDGIPNLDRQRNKICIESATSAVALDLRSFVDFDERLDRILQIPAWQIRDAVFSGIPCGITREEAEALTDFLIERRRSLRTLFHTNQKNKDIFPHVGGLFATIKPEPEPVCEYDDYCI